MEQQTEKVDESGRSTPFGCYLRGAGCLLTVVFVAAILLPALARSGSGRRFSCANNMKQIGLGLRMYSNEDPRELFPTLASAPGRLMFEVNLMYPVYQPDPSIMLCPKDSDFAKFARSPRSTEDFTGVLKKGVDEGSLFDDWSYFYLGYAVLNDEDIGRFAQAYREHMRDGTPLVDDIVGPDDPDGKKTVYRLHEGVEGHLIARLGVSPDDPGASSRAQSEVPILIERVENHQGKKSGRKFAGANILYLDGHVDFVEYPGKWPMTEKTVHILNELDALGDAPVAK